MNLNPLTSAFLVTIALFANFQICADPLSDKKLTCEEMRNSPEVFENSIDLGSGYGSWVEVDYECPERLDKLEFLNNVEATARLIRGKTPYGCGGTSGTIIYARERYRLWDQLGWGLAPQENAKRYKDLNANDADVWEYLKWWGYQGLYQYESLAQFLSAYTSAHPILSAHYQAEFRAPQREADRYADWALMHFTFWAAGRSNPSEAVFSDWDTPEKLQRFLAKADTTAALQSLKAAVLEKQSVEILGKIIEELENPNQGDETAMHVAMTDLSIAKFLLSKGLEVDYENYFGKTPLYYAVERNQEDIIRLLIENGANVNHTYKSNKDPEIGWGCNYEIYNTSRSVLMHAAQHSRLSTVKLLISFGADKEARDDRGHNAATYASQAGQKEVEAFLLGLAEAEGR